MRRKRTSWRLLRRVASNQPTHSAPGRRRRELQRRVDVGHRRRGRWPCRSRAPQERVRRAPALGRLADPQRVRRARRRAVPGRTTIAAGRPRPSYSGRPRAGRHGHADVGADRARSRRRPARRASRSPSASSAQSHSCQASHGLAPSMPSLHVDVVAARAGHDLVRRRRRARRRATACGGRRRRSAVTIHGVPSGVSAYVTRVAAGGRHLVGDRPGGHDRPAHDAARARAGRLRRRSSRRRSRTARGRRAPAASSGGPTRTTGSSTVSGALRAVGRRGGRRRTGPG